MWLLYAKVFDKTTTKSLTKFFQNIPSPASKHFKLAMHMFGLMTQASTLQEMDEMVISANMVFSSSSSGENIEKHFENPRVLLTKAGPCVEDESIATVD